MTEYTAFISIISAVLITMIGVGVEPTGRGTAVTEKVAFADAFLSVSNVIFAYGKPLRPPLTLSLAIRH